ncbi:DUF3800 domain-containing protein [Micromonospora cremea]|uniref:DUF3800 domain-containing protein n=1 Tax=Micromonospora cremea TaxID=709881 RepID=UPI003CC7E2B7
MSGTGPEADPDLDTPHFAPSHASPLLQAVDLVTFASSDLSFRARTRASQV